jgi:hypothetical protein
MARCTMGRGKPGTARPSPLLTTLYDLITIIQDIVGIDGFMTELGAWGSNWNGPALADAQIFLLGRS